MYIGKYIFKVTMSTYELLPPVPSKRKPWMVTARRERVRRSSQSDDVQIVEMRGNDLAAEFD